MQVGGWGQLPLLHAAVPPRTPPWRPSGCAQGVGSPGSSLGAPRSGTAENLLAGPRAHGCAWHWTRRPEGVSFHPVTHSHVCGRRVTSDPNLQPLGRAVPAVPKAVSAPGPDTVRLTQKGTKGPSW